MSTDDNYARERAFYVGRWVGRAILSLVGAGALALMVGLAGYAAFTIAKLF